MFKQEVQNQIQQHYDKLISLGYNVVGVFLYGSQNYELDYSGSDVDSKAIILPTLNDIVFNRQPVSTTLDMGNGCLCDVKDIRKMFECFKKQNINFVELLFTQYYILNPIYEELFAPMFDNAEKIARYNNYASVNCMCGMAFEKYKAHYELEYSKNLAKETCEWIKQYKQEYMENNPLEINTEAKDVMEKVMTNLITFSIKNEVCRNE